MMKNLTIFCLFIFGISAEFIRRDVSFDTSMKIEEAHERVSSRLGGGNVAGNTDFPFVTDISTFWSNGEVRGCTGSIIATFIIMTSRECLFDDTLRIKPDTVFVQVGSAMRGVARFGTLVTDAIWLDRQGMPQGPHPNFAIANLANLLVMSPSVNVIRLPSFPQSTMAFTNIAVDIAGWGPSTGQNLHSARVTISPRMEGTVIGLTEYEFMCFPSTAVFENGDTGGPMFLREQGGDTLIGTLWTARFSTTTNSNVITAMQIGQFWDFIHDVTGIPRRWN